MTLQSSRGSRCVSRAPVSSPATAEQALARGDARTARALYEEITLVAPTATAWLGLAHACRTLGDKDAELNAVNKAIELEPRNVPALLFKGDFLFEQNDKKAALSFYAVALRSAPSLGRIPENLRQDLHRAQTRSAHYAKNYEAQLRERLAADRLVPSLSSRRFSQSLELLFGQKQIYFQQPSQYFFPELPQIQFYNRKDFPWLGSIESATDVIRSELLDVLRDEAAFLPYVEETPNRPPPDNASMTGNLDWSAYFLWKNGQLIQEHAARCPETTRVVQSAPLCAIDGRTPSVLFSRLRPRTRIPPHTGLINTRLICHLPLIVPDNCVFRVGNEIREWKVGEAFVFDDTIEHEARNDSDQARVVLIFDVWRPELTMDERTLVTALLGAMDSYGAPDAKNDGAYSS